MNARDRTSVLTALLLQAGWGRDAAAAALASASRDATAAGATLRAIETTRLRALDATRATMAAEPEPAAMQRGLVRLAAIERLRHLAAGRHDEAMALLTRRRDASLAAQSRVDALERRRDVDGSTARQDAARRAADEVDRQWLAMRASGSEREEAA